MLYRIILSLRHFFYDRGWKKSRAAEVPTIGVGNLTVGGTGKTPHTELLLRILLASDEWAYKGIAVLSRGYKRRTGGFQKVPRGGSARLYGDEPVQIASKFPSVTVAVDKKRVRGCHILVHPDEAPKRCREKDIEKADIVVLDDVFQYRKLSPTLNIVLMDYSRPVHKDRILPWGRLRDLPSRLLKADIVVVTKCPAYIDHWAKQQWRKDLGLREGQKLFFTTLTYGAPQPVFPEGDSHYIYSQRLVLVTGIANDAPLRSYLSDSYKIVSRLHYRDHHRFSRRDIRTISSAAKGVATACIMTTEKDAQRLRDVKRVPERLRKRFFYLPVETSFLTAEEEAAFKEAVLGALI